jgi:hypothetical protein
MYYNISHHPLWSGIDDQLWGMHAANAKKIDDNMSIKNTILCGNKSMKIAVFGRIGLICSIGIFTTEVQSHGDILYSYNQNLYAGCCHCFNEDSHCVIFAE